MGSWSAAEIRSWGKRNRPGDSSLPSLFSANQLGLFQENVIAGLYGATEEAMVAALKRKARSEQNRVIADQSQRSGGYAPLPRQYVDGREDKTLRTVEANSTIVIDWSYTPEVAGRTFTALVERSPHGTGHYIEGLLRFVDGGQSDFSTITFDTREVQIVASVDYARRLEVGRDASGAPWVKEVAPHIVEETAIIARRKFGRLANITYTYVDLANAYQIKGHQYWRRRGGLVDTTVRYPAIVIVPL